MSDIRQQLPDAVIKPASTAAVAADPSLVVALSPNSPTPAGTNTIGSVKLTDGTSVPAVKSGAVAPVATDNALVVAISPNAVLLVVGPIGNGGNSTAAPLTIGGVDAGGVVRNYTPVAKGIQAATAMPVTAMKDTGRVGIAFTAYQIAGITLTEALFAAAMVSSRDGAAPSAAASQFSVTAAKRLVIQNISLSIKNNNAAAFSSKLVLRYSAAGGTISNTSPILGIWDLGTSTAVAGTYIGPITLPFPDGVELLSNSTFGFTNLSNSAANLHTITLNGYEY